MNTRAHQYPQGQNTDRVNRNLSPSLANIRIAPDTTPNRVAQNRDGQTDANAHKQPANISDSPASKKAQAESTHLPIENGDAIKNPSLTPARTQNRAATPIRMTPWIIACVTLTLALFSANYAWQIQQQVEDLALRFQQLETPLPAGEGLTEAQQRTQSKLSTLEAKFQAVITTQAEQQTSIDANRAQLEQGLAELQETQASLSTTLEAIKTEHENQAITKKALLSDQASRPSPISQSSQETALSLDTNRAHPKSWFINVASFSNQNTANKLAQKIRTAGFNAAVTPIKINNKTLYRIRASAYHSRDEAERQAQDLQSKLKLTGLWVSKE